MESSRCHGSEPMEKVVRKQPEKKKPNNHVNVSITLNVRYLIEPVHEKTNNLGFRTGLTQTGLYKHRKELEA